MSRYVEQLISDGLLGNALDALRRFTLETEMELLQNNRALPPGRHHATLVSTIETTRYVGQDDGLIWQILLFIKAAHKKTRYKKTFL